MKFPEKYQVIMMHKSAFSNSVVTRFQLCETATEALRIAKAERLEHHKSFDDSNRPELTIQFTEICVYPSIHSVRVYAKSEFDMAILAKQEFAETVQPLLPTPEEAKEAQK